MLDQWERLYDGTSLLLVAGGTAAVTALRWTRRDLFASLRALRPLLRARPEEDGEAAARAVRQIQRISDHKGTVCADRVKTPVAFVHRAACRLAEAETAEAFESWAREVLDDQAARHAAAAGVWRSAAESAPALGMVGTVLGLAAMFAVMREPAAMGPAMALAMLTTLYGLLLATLAGTVAARLERLSEAERAWREKTVARLLALARAEEEARGRWRCRRDLAS